MKVLCKLPLSVYSGYGNDGIGLVQALVKMGADVYLQPTHINAPLPAMVTDLLRKELAAPFDLLINHIDPYQMGLYPHEVRASKFILGWTMWEKTKLHERHRGVRTFDRRLRDFNLVLSYDEISYQAMEPVIPPNVIHKKLQGGADFSQWEYVDRNLEGPFRFIMVGQLHQRKDPFVAIDAFRELKADLGSDFDDAELHLKTNIPGLHPEIEQWIPKCRVHYTVWPIEIMQQFYANSHVLLAPSRGEGKNMPALEFQATGGVVIATAWGGHSEWLDSSYAYPLKFRLMRASGVEDTLEARADKEHLKELMVHCYNNRAECRSKGQLASRTIVAMCSWDKVLERLMLNIKECGDAGRELYTASMFIRSKEAIRDSKAGGQEAYI